MLHVGFGNRDESAVGEFETLRGVGGSFCDPALDRDTSYHNAGPLHRFHEDCAFATFGQGTKDGFATLCYLGFDGVKREVDEEVHGGSPFGGVGLHAELGAWSVDLCDNNLDGCGGAFGWFLLSVEPDDPAFSEVTCSAGRGTFGHGGHESRGGDVIVFWLRCGNLLLGGGCGLGKRFGRGWFGFGPAGRDGGPRVLGREGVDGGSGEFRLVLFALVNTCWGVGV